MEGMLEKAVRFAFEKHEGQVRKGTELPYIVHPMEVMKLLNEMDADENLLIAGLLHDVVEDGGVTVGEIRMLFGEDVAGLVAGHSEDKSKTWKERKEEDIKATKEGDIRLKMLVLADKLSNLRSLYFDYTKLGEEVWKRFNASVIEQAWYYSEMIDALDALQYEKNTELLYWELNALFKEVFVTFYYDETVEMLYQRCVTGEEYSLMRGNPVWKPFYGEIPGNLSTIHRKLAERLEDTWADEFDFQIRKDLNDGNYLLFATPRTTVSVEISEQKLCFVYEVIRSKEENIHGKYSDKEVHELSEYDTMKFLYALRMQYVLDYPLAKVLEQELGETEAKAKFEMFCKQFRISYQKYIL